MTGDVLVRWPGVVMDTYGTPSLTLVRGEGAHVWDDAGREYVDLVAGIAVNVLGHAHPAVVAAVTRQVSALGHVSNLYAHAGVVELAERLLARFGRDGRVFFCNSGAEANEAAFKLARRTGRPEVVAAEGAFHGRTMGALALTGQPAKREPFRPLPGEVGFVPYGDAEALEAAVSERTAAVFLEPVLGEAGVVPAPPSYLAAAREITAARGALLVLDEVQTGIGRTGAWFAHQHAGVLPDVVTLAKGLGGGLPIGACVAFGPAGSLLHAGQHGTTFGANPISCAAALAVLDVIAADDLCGRAKVLGERLSRGITGLRSPLIAGVRGPGLMLGVLLTAPVAKTLEGELRTAGFLVNAVATDVIRLVPPLVLSDADADAFLAALPAALRRTAGQVPT
jgi:acetylornithine aminotransferase